MMRPIHFCYYLQGFVETTNVERPTVEQWDKILEQFKNVQGSGSGTDDPYSHQMMPHAFVSWLRGFIEISAVAAPNEREWQIIKDHLQLVFTKVTPTYTNKKPEPEPEQEPEPTRETSDKHLCDFNPPKEYCTLDELDLTPPEIEKILNKLKEKSPPRNPNEKYCATAFSDKTFVDPNRVLICALGPSLTGDSKKLNAN